MGWWVVLAAAANANRYQRQKNDSCSRYKFSNLIIPENVNKQKIGLSPGFFLLSHSFQSFLRFAWVISSIGVTDCVLFPFIESNSAKRNNVLFVFF